MPIPLGILAVAGAGAGGGGAFDLLETTLISTNTASVTFSSLGSYSAYKHLQLRVVARTSNASADGDGLLVKINSSGDTNLYSWHDLAGNGSTVFSTATINQFTMNAGYNTGSTSTANAFGVSVIDILDFSNTSKNKTLKTLTGLPPSGNQRIGLHSGNWRSTNAVTSIILTNQSAASFVAGSRFSLYGIK